MTRPAENRPAGTWPAGTRSAGRPPAPRITDLATPDPDGSLSPRPAASHVRLLRRIAAVLAVLAGTVVAAPPVAARDSLTIGITQFPSTLHPNIDSMLAKTYILAMTQRPITHYDHSWKLVCGLCIALPTIENGKAVPVTLPDGGDGIVLTFTLHSDATWGDGTPVTTADVLFTWEVGRHPQSGVSNAELYRRITRVEAVDTKTFTLHINKRTYNYNAINDFKLLPAHLDAEAFRDPALYKQRTRFDTDATNPGLAFGPYRITDRSPGQYIALEPNPTWYGAAPHFKRIVVRTIENTAALEANLLSGSIDMIAGELGMRIDQALAFETRHGDRYAVRYENGLIYEHVDLNLDNPILADVRVRQALLFALDRERIVDRLFDGRQPVAITSLSPDDGNFSAAVPRYGFDPARAAALLDAAGWTGKRGGIRHSADGTPLRLDFMTTAGDQSRELVQQLLQSQWRDVGIDVRIRNQPARVLFGETVTKRRFTGLVMYAWISAPDTVPRTTLHSDMIPRADNNWAGQNYVGLDDRRFDHLLDSIEVELDVGKRRELWADLQRLYVEHLPVLPLYFRANAYVLPPWLDGVRPTGHLVPSTLWIEDWRPKQ